MFFLSLFVAYAANAQLTGVKNIPGDYATLALAITDLNTQGVGVGGVTLNMVAGNPETAPAGGYVVGGTGSLVLTTASSSNTIRIVGNGNIITAPTPQASGILVDGIFKMIGADWTTITGFTMLENASNTTTAFATNNMTEFGVALFYATLTDGANNNTIQNNNISLNRTYANTFGIYSNTRHSAIAPTTPAEITAASGSNSFNKVYTNSISNVNYGIVFIGAGTTIAAIDNGNDIGGTSTATGNTLTNWGGIGVTTSSYTSLTVANCGINLNQQIGDNVSFNSITSFPNGSTGTISIVGIFKAYSLASPTAATFVSSINSNTITVSASPAAGAGSVSGILSANLTATVGATININNNLVTNCALTGTASTTGNLIGIQNGSASGILNINGNTINGLLRNAGTTGQIQGILNLGGVVTTLNMNNNFLGTSTLGFASYTTYNGGTGALFGYGSQAAAATCAVSIQNNDLQGIAYAIDGTNGHQYLSASGTPLTNNVSNNTFTNLTARTSGTVTFVAQSYTMPVGGSQIFNSNSIVTAFNKTVANGGVVIFTSGGSSPNTATASFTNNNFSNITVLGTSAITGISNTDGAGTAPTKTVTGNTFNNWSAVTGAIIGMSFTYWGAPSTTSTLSNNTLTNFSNQAAITGVNIGSSFSGTGTVNIANNVINSYTSSLAGGTIQGISCSNSSSIININNHAIFNFTTTGTTATGINITGSTLTNVFKNNIYNLSSTNTTPGVNGIAIGGGITTNAYNNFVSGLRAPAANATVPIYGINISGGTNAGIYYNTIALGRSATITSTGATFGVTGIGYNSTTNSTLRNNIVWIDATSTGTGTIAAVRRGTAGVANTAPSATNFSSNNNIYFVALAPGTAPVAANINKYLYLEGNVSTTATNGYGVDIGQVDNLTLNLKSDPSFNTPCGIYKTFMGSRETATFTENNLSIGSGNDFVPIGSSFAADNAQPISNPSITDDYNSFSRATTPDVGALEFVGINVDAAAPSISFFALPNTVCSASPTLAAIITDASGVNVTPGLAPRLYYRKGAATAEADVFGTYPGDNVNTFNGWKYVEATGTAPNFTFAIDYTLLTSPMVLGDSLTYFVVAQDLASTPNVGRNSVSFPPTFCPTSVVIPSTGAVPTAASLGYRIISVGTVQPFNTAITAGTIDNQVLRIDIPASTCYGNITTLNFTNASTVPADIANAKVYYTTTTIFSTATLFGTAVANPGATFSVSGTQASVLTGTNYFWLVYDVSCTAPSAGGNVADASLVSVTTSSSGSLVPTTTNPTGTRAITAFTNPTITTLQPATTAVTVGATNNQVLRVSLNASSCLGTISQLDFTNTNTSGDIIRAKVFYTTTATFSTAVQFGADVNAPGATFSVSGTQVSPTSGIVYFWLVYDLSCSATVGATIDGGLTSLVSSLGTLTPGTPNPIGTRSIAAAIVGDFVQTAPLAILSASGGNPYSISGKSLQTGEPTPIINSQPSITNGSGQSNYSWGAAGGNTQWYRLVVPTSGYGSSGNLLVRATTAASPNDAQVAVWKFPNMVVGTCAGDPANFTGGVLLAANDDAIVTGTGYWGASADGFNSVARVRLIPGQTYYVQIDGYQTDIPAGDLIVEDLADPLGKNVSNNGFGAIHNPTAVDMRSASYEVIGDDGWTYYYNNNGTSDNIVDDVVILGLNWSSSTTYLWNGSNAVGNDLLNHVRRSARSFTAPSITAPASSTGDDAFIVWSGRNNASAASNDLALTDGGYVRFTNWWMMNKFWNVFPNVQPTTAVGVRFFYSDADYTALQTTVSAGGGTLAAKADMRFIKATKSATTHYTNAEMNPASGHGAITIGTVSDLVWVNTDNVQPAINQAQYSITTFSGGGGGSTGTINSVLPIAIEFFKGAKQANGNLLDWKVTCTSASTVTLTLERSATGNNFKAINTQTETAARCLQGFNYTDATPLAGANYYRLKISTPDGAFRHSNIVVILNKDRGFELISLAPNPVKDVATLSLTSAKAGRIELTIADIAGKILTKKSVEVIAGNNPIMMNFANIGAGTYVIMAVNADGETKTTRFVKF